MSYTKSYWMERHAGRSDLTAYVAHFTRPVGDGDRTKSAIDVLLDILEQRRLVGSTSESGFINGSTPAVCFQDAPIYALAQNIYIEQKLQKQLGLDRPRYVSTGLLFEKPYVFQNGGRPVIYEDPRIAKQFLPRDEWWRIVRYDLSDENAFVDWTHEREWRIPNDFHFTREKVTVLVPSHGGYRRFIEKALERDPNLLKEILGIVNLGAVFY